MTMVRCPDCAEWAPRVCGQCDGTGVISERRVAKLAEYARDAREWEEYERQEAALRKAAS